MAPRGLVLALLPLALLPSVAACSLAAHPFDSASFDEEDGDLWYVDGAASLRRQHGALEVEVEDAFMLSYATLPGEGLLIAGQDGLGGDCSGTDWLELRRDGAVVWRREGRGDDSFDATRSTWVSSHPLGPFAQLDGRFWRLDGDELVEVGRPTADSWVLGFDAGGQPVKATGQDVYVDGHHLRLALTGYATAMASGDGQTAIVERIDWSITVVHVVIGDQVYNVTWRPPQGWEPTAAWSDVFVLSVGGRAYRVTDQVVDLGVDDVVAVAARGQHTAVFTEDGYVVFDGTQPIERWTRGDGAWTPGAVPLARSTVVQSEFSPSQTLLEGEPPGRAAGEGGLDIPSAGLVAALAAVAAALARRKA